MSVSPATVISRLLPVSHQWVLQFVEPLTEEQLRRQAGPLSPCIAFHLWHSARWADLLQSKLPGMTPQLGERLGARPVVDDSLPRPAAERGGVNRGGVERAAAAHGQKR